MVLNEEFQAFWGAILRYFSRIFFKNKPETIDNMQQMYTYLWAAYDLENNLQAFHIPSKFNIVMAGEWE